MVGCPVPNQRVDFQRPEAGAGDVEGFVAPFEENSCQDTTLLEAAGG